LDIKVKISPYCSDDYITIKQKWENLELTANNSFFISWVWISSWLKLIDKSMFLVEAIYENKIVGLAFFVENTRHVFGIIPVKQWLLHRTGEEKSDQIWIEYNDFLLDSSVSEKTRVEMTKAISNYNPKIKEFVIGLSSTKIINYIAPYFSSKRELLTSCGYLINFAHCSESYEKQVLSKNARSQINRSIKLLNAEGKLEHSVITDIAQIEVLMPQVAALHIARWQSEPEGSGFNNQFFNTFHQQMLLSDTKQNVQLSVLTLNGTHIGFLMCFVYKNNVSFYLSALTASTNSKIKIGLTLHYKTILHYQTLGIEKYDFLAGDARYKSSLSNDKYNMALVLFSRSNILLRIENYLRDIKQLLMGIKHRIMKV
jgi:hypothetical protein